MAVPRKPALAFLGLGQMGAPMAERLLAAGFEVAVWNRSSEKAVRLERRGAVVAATPADAVRGADIVCLCLLNSSATDEILSDAQGAFAGAAPGALLLDFCSTTIAATRAFAARAREHRMDWVDAPVSGGSIGATTGRLVVFCGGAAVDVERARPVLDAVAAKVSHMGGVGAGQATKLCNQLIVSTTLLTVAEALTLACRLQIDPARLPSALEGGFADSILLQVFGPRMLTRPPDLLGVVSTMTKDVEAVSAAAEQAGLRLPVYEEVVRSFVRAERAGLSKRDLSALIDLYSAGADHVGDAGRPLAARP